jgi:hypothetical protein
MVLANPTCVYIIYIYGSGKSYLCVDTVYTWFWPTLPVCIYRIYMVLANLPVCIYRIYMVLANPMYKQGWPEPYICGVYTVFLAGKSSNIRSYGVYIHSSCQPYTYTRFWSTLQMCPSYDGTAPLYQNTNKGCNVGRRDSPKSKIICISAGDQLC